MEINISSNLQEEIAKLVNADIEGAVEKALDRSAQEVLSEKSQQIAKTYARPVRKLKNGRDAYKRSGDLQSQQAIESRAGERTIGPVGSSEKYEGALANLPVSKDGVNRRNPAAQETVRVVEPKINDIFEGELRDALGI